MPKLKAVKTIPGTCTECRPSHPIPLSPSPFYIVTLNLICFMSSEEQTTSFLQHAAEKPLLYSVCRAYPVQHTYVRISTMNHERCPVVTLRNLQSRETDDGGAGSYGKRKNSNIRQISNLHFMIQIFQGRYIPHLYDLHDLDHAAGSEPHYLRDLERVSWVESVLG